MRRRRSTKCCLACGSSCITAASTSRSRRWRQARPSSLFPEHLEATLTAAQLHRLGVAHYMKDRFPPEIDCHRHEGIADRAAASAPCPRVGRAGSFPGAVVSAAALRSLSRAFGLNWDTCSAIPSMRLASVRASVLDMLLGKTSDSGANQARYGMRSKMMRWDRRQGWMLVGDRSDAKVKMMLEIPEDGVIILSISEFAPRAFEW